MTKKLLTSKDKENSSNKKLLTGNGNDSGKKQLIKTEPSPKPLLKDKPSDKGRLNG